MSGFGRSANLRDRSILPLHNTPSPSHSSAAADELERQNDDRIEGLSAKVRAMRDLSVSLGNEITASNRLVAEMDNAFHSTQDYLRGTYRNMTRMAKTAGVGWFHIFLFFAAVTACFFLYWLIK